MNSELDALEHKVDQVLALCGDLHADNISLRARVASLENENQSLTARMETARTRLEALLPNLPEE